MKIGDELDHYRPQDKENQHRTNSPHHGQTECLFLKLFQDFDRAEGFKAMACALAILKPSVAVL